MNFTQQDVENTKVVHVFDKDGYDIYIGRPSQWENLYTHIKHKATLAKYVCNTREESISNYEEWIRHGEGQQLLKYLHELVGKRLACWCSPQPCHGDILVKLVHEYFSN